MKQIQNISMATDIQSAVQIIHLHTRTLMINEMRWPKKAVAEEVFLQLGLKGSLSLQQADRSTKQRKWQSQVTEARTSRGAKRKTVGEEDDSYPAMKTVVLFTFQFAQRPA